MMDPLEQTALTDLRTRNERHGAKSMIAKTRNSAKALLSRSPAFRRLESTSTIHEQQTPSRTPTASGYKRKSFEGAYVQTPQDEARKKNDYQEIELDPWLQVEGSSALDNDRLPIPEISRTRKSQRNRRDSTIRDRFSHSLHNWWQEWVLLFTALIILMTIVVVLRVLNKQPQPEWKLGVNLNTLIAVLATLFRSSLVTIVEEVISQAKWSWQQGHRTASDLAFFDKASRGPLGALLLHFRVPGLLHRKSGNIKYGGATAIACTVTVLSLAVGAFTQQALKAVPCRFPALHANATIPVTRFAHPFANDSLPGSTSRDFNVAMKGQIVSALGSPEFVRSKFLQGCSTGNCTFESIKDVTHVTSGFCSRCIETTDKLEKLENFTVKGTNGSAQIKRAVRFGTLPALILALDQGKATYQGLSTNSYTKAYEPMFVHPDNLQTVINVASITKAPCSPGVSCSGFWDNYLRSDGLQQVNWTGWNTVSVQCGLYPCARHMKAEAQNGQFTETVIRETLYPPEPSTQFVNRTGKITGTVPAQFIAPCWLNGTRYDSPPTKNITATYNQYMEVVDSSPCAYGTSIAFSNRMRAFISLYANGNCSVPIVDDISTIKCLSGSSIDNLQCLGRIDHICIQDQWWLQNLFNSGNASFESISTIVENLAMALTDSARAQPYDGVSLIPGTIWSSTVCTEFNWPWIWFPVILVALTVYSLMSITLRTALDKDDPPVWKSSTLPIIFGQAAPMDSAPYGKSLKELSAAAKEHGLVLIEHEGHWGLKVLSNGEAREA